MTALVSPVEPPEDWSGGSAGLGVDSRQLVDAVAALARGATGDFTIDDLLHRLCEVAAATLPVDGAGVMAFDGTRARFVRASTPLVVGVGELQETLQAGPCRDCLESGEPVLAEDIAAAGRWPEFTALAAAAGLAAVLTVPLRSRGQSWGSLDLYRTAATEWTPDQVAAARLLADVAVSYLVMAADRDTSRAAQVELAHRSTHDQLTGLPNRVLLFDRIDHALTQGARHGTAVTVVFLDLDHFKGVNDTFGHTTGDAVLVEAAHRMATAVRDGDTVARLAGDEFVVVCEDLPRRPPGVAHQRLRAVVDRIATALAAPVRVGDVEVVVSASVGAVIADDHPTPADLLRDADAAMYQAKADGRDRLVLWDRGSGPVVGFRRQLERALPHALDRGELRVHYQPIRSTRDGRITAVEALLRWEHPRHGLLPAADFVDLAEAAGAIAAIGRWVITQACAQLAAWRRDLPGRAPQIVFVNISPKELIDPRLEATVAASLAEHHLAAADLGLEILESQFADPRLAPVLTRWQQRGHPLSIDDFGTGYSALSRLVSLPVAYAKIDRAIVEDLPTGPRSRALVDAVLTVGHTLGLRIIGEGVETDTQRDHLTAAGCDLLQGYHLGAPASAPEITAELAAQP